MIKKLLSKLGAKTVTAHKRAGAQAGKKYKKLPKRIQDLGSDFDQVLIELANK